MEFMPREILLHIASYLDPPAWNSFSRTKREHAIVCGLLKEEMKRRASRKKFVIEGKEDYDSFLPDGSLYGEYLHTEEVDVILVGRIKTKIRVETGFVRNGRIFNKKVKFVPTGYQSFRMPPAAVTIPITADEASACIVLTGRHKGECTQL